MGNWIISPDDGVVNNNDGTFVLPCSTSNVNYSITYVDLECSSNTISYTYVTSGSCSTPVCPTQSSIINTNTTVASTGGTQVAVMQILKDSTYTAYTITATSTSSSYVSNITQGAHLHDNWYVVLADVTANPNTSDRSLYFDVIAEGPTLGTGCTYNNVKVTQNAGCPTVYYHGSTIPTEGSPMGLPLMYWSPSDDYPLNTFSVSYTGDGITSTEFITSSSLIPGQTVNVLLVKFSANTGTSSRTFNVHLSTSVSSDCTWDNTYTQEGADSCPASGDVITGDREVPGCASSWSGHLQFKTGDTAFTSDISIVGDGTVVIGGFLDNNTQPGYRMIVITTSENPSTSAARNGSITITVGKTDVGTCTYTVPITQKKRDSSYCQTLSQATIRYTNNTGTQIQDGIGYLYDSSNNEIGEFRIDALAAGNSLDYPIGGESLGKTVAKVIAKMHLVGSGDLVCRNCLGSGIISERLEAGHTYAVNIGNDAC